MPLSIKQSVELSGEPERGHSVFLASSPMHGCVVRFNKKVSPRKMISEGAGGAGEGEASGSAVSGILHS